MLSWLDPDRERAGVRYEEIRAKLIARFTRLRCVEPEDLANKTIDRVAQILPKVIDRYKGRQEPYFYSVAYFIYEEYLKKPAALPLPETDLPQPDPPKSPELLDNEELLDSCLSKCVQSLSEASRDVILHYYRGERQVKIRLRKELAERLGIKLENLRLKAQRIRESLKRCISDCVKSDSVT
jgi:DNA-directed RNA polymerase specialized sigma24 family protein